MTGSGPTQAVPLDCADERQPSGSREAEDGLSRVLAVAHPYAVASKPPDFDAIPVRSTVGTLSPRFVAEINRTHLSSLPAKPKQM